MSEKYKNKTLAEIINIEQAKNLLNKNLRKGDRGLLDYRDIKIETGTIKKAFGSATVNLGDTVVVAGVNFELGTPFIDTPNNAILLVEGEILPTASVEAEAGPPDEHEIEISRVIDRGIRESGMINFEKYVIIPGETVIKIFVDFNIINDDGNIIDAANLAAVAALATAEIPKVEYIREHIDEVNNINIKEIPRESFKVEEIPIANTIGIFDGKVLVDPDAAEEEVVDTLITFTHLSTGEICSVQLLKGGLTYEEVFKTLDVAYQKNLELREILKNNGISL
ncbi:MAG TPA: exosome complex protein Rrp42 [Thermoprotei archaeon]|nr:exosome complex protein Rrp42 [Thermoprotei archaeon]